MEFVALYVFKNTQRYDHQNLTDRSYGVIPHFIYIQIMLYSAELKAA